MHYKEFLLQRLWVSAYATLAFLRQHMLLEAALVFATGIVGYFQGDLSTKVFSSHLGSSHAGVNYIIRIRLSLRIGARTTTH